MTEIGFITIEDLVPRDFLQRPMAVLGEFGNGMGKTHSSALYAVKLQKIGIFDRIYILEYSQEGCSNVCRKIVKFGGWCIHHIGIEKFCPRYNQIKPLIQRGIPPSYLCNSCPFFRGRSRAAYTIFKTTLEQRTKQWVKPELVTQGLDQRSRVCTHPIIRYYVFEPTFERKKGLRLPETPIIVVPSQLFLNHSVIARWRKYSRRQRRPQKILLIVDEADTVFYSSLKIEIPKITPTNDDYEILRTFSPKTRPLTNLIHLYEWAYKLVEEVYKRRGQVTRDDLDRLASIKRKAEPLLSSFDRRRNQIVDYVIRNNITTNVFKIVFVLQELINIDNPKYALRSVELVGDKYILYDYDFGVRLLFDTEYPWKHFWKIVLSATFPTEKILDSNLVSPQSKRILLSVRRRTKTYENVYVSIAPVFETDSGVLNRNEAIKYSIPRLLGVIKKAIVRYEKVFGRKPGGVTVWFGNSKQLRTFVSTLRARGVKFQKRGALYITKYRGIPLVCSYCGSSVSRGLDFQQYDISIVVSPLLRPPRQGSALDVIDFARGVAEAIQSAMRIVRSPKPPTPKLVILEHTMTTAFYSSFYPDWFRQLFVTSFLDLEEDENEAQ